MEWTDRHYRFLVRGLTKRTVLYTEMVVDDAVNHSPNLDFLIGKNIEENPSVIQLGGSCPSRLAMAAERCVQYGGGYSEINLNCGCPSQRVSKRCFGAKLMEEPDLVREIISSMQRRVDIPVTIKCRIGTDCKDSYDDLCSFIRIANSGGCQKFVIHARKCFLNGLTTKQNRDIPPLRYDVAHKLVEDFPDLAFVMNGGIVTFDQALAHLNPSGYYAAISAPISDTPIDSAVAQSQAFSLGREALESSIFSCEKEDNGFLPPMHGVMVGRAAYSNPLMFASADSTFFGVRDPYLSRRQLLGRLASL